MPLDSFTYSPNALGVNMTRPLLTAIFLTLFSQTAWAATKHQADCDEIHKQMQRNWNVAKEFRKMKDQLRRTAARDQGDYQKFKEYESLEAKNLSTAADYAALFTAICKN